MNKKAPIYIALLSSLLLWNCSKDPKSEANAESTAEKVVDIVHVSEAQAKNIQLPVGGFEQTIVGEEVTANGKVEVPPQQMISVSVPIAGFVKSFSLLPGTPVRKGQVLAVVQSMEYVQLQQEYLQALSKQKFQEQDLSRQETLNQENVGSKKKLQQIDSEYQTGKAMIKGLEEKLKLIGCNIAKLKAGNITPSINVISPINGVTKMVYVNIGKNIAPTDVMMELVSREHMHLELNVFEKDANKVQVGQTLLLENPRLADKPLTGKVILVGQTIEGPTKAILVHGHLDNEVLEQKLVVGQYVNTKILTGKKAVQTLPEDAVVRRGEGGFIFVRLKTNSYQQVPVKLGITENGMVEIILEKTLPSKEIVKANASILQAMLAGGEGE
ncbi:efflux RND transporter periplasmic adaptor subunit [Cellulophaga sp. BC115SP]|uniref:efflux RND transporter periplasmic adaptor subunit n=1 Tax=Cellulophaga sp. BC115SP TaxID=2683263 RepID=UPI001412126A|nr:efflux RND transporter periplasmic adaptor subunit [Cellulophaga sp. BC115SP]NBB28669.1 efflux RND transporter periplasmic adaptor subunit [Cellulophaga sp. BC115SP]